MAKNNADLLEAPDLAERILELLAKRQALPTQGIVAGQAVASAIDELLGTGPAVYNDIDIFMVENEWMAVTGELFPCPTIPPKKLLTERVAFQTESQLYANDYSMAFTITNKTLYRVVKVERDELLNFVLVEFCDKEGARVPQLIEMFDLNNIQVAVDLKTRTLVYTKGFEEYFVGRELKIDRLFTPFQSLLRYFKKRDELGAYGNDDLQIEMVRHIVYENEGDPLFREDRIQAFTSGYQYVHPESARAWSNRQGRQTTTSRTGTGVLGLPLAIGRKYEALLERWLPKLEPYFDLWKHPRIPVWLITSRPDAPRLTKVPQLPRDPAVFAARFREEKLPASALTRKRREEFARFLIWLKDDLREMYRIAFKHYGDAFLEGVESQQGWRALQRVLNAHDEVISTVATLPIGQQIELIRHVRAELKRINLPEAWGLFRGKNLDWATRALKDPTWLREQINSLVGPNLPLYPEECLLPLPADVGGIQVRELYRSHDLICEGARMRHCVGGYSSVVETRNSLIVSLVGGPSSKDCSTIEWRPVIGRYFDEDEMAEPATPVRLDLVQHYSFGNSRPADKLVELENTLREEMNAWLKENSRAGYEMFSLKSRGDY